MANPLFDAIERKQLAEVGHGARSIQSDIENLADIDRLFAVVKNEAGAIDILFANAGGGEFAPLGDYRTTL